MKMPNFMPTKILDINSQKHLKSFLEAIFFEEAEKLLGHKIKNAKKHLNKTQMKVSGIYLRELWLQICFVYEYKTEMKQFPNYVNFWF